jgi:hypothetical protein
MEKPSNPAPTTFQKPTAMKHMIGHLYACTRAPPGALVVAVSFDADHRQRHHFERRKHRADRNDEGRRAGEIQVMQRTRMPPNRNTMVSSTIAVLAVLVRINPRRVNSSDHGGGEHLEKAFNPRCTNHQRQYSIIE